MTCRELSEFLLEYLSGELAADAQAGFEAHLLKCPECVAYVRSYRETIRLGKRAFEYPDAAVPPETPEDLVQSILAVRTKGQA